MSRRCELTGKGVLTGNNVSHANNKSRRRYLPNLNTVTVTSETLGRRFRLRICMRALKSIDHNGGFDTFLMKCKNEVLSPRALDIKRAVKKAAVPEAEAAA